MRQHDMLTIDLHGTRHHEVERLLIRKIEDNWDSNRTLTIITGNSEKMKDLVKEILYDYKLSFTDGDEWNVLNKGVIKTNL